MVDTTDGNSGWKSKANVSVAQRILKAYVLTIDLLGVGKSKT